MKRQLLAALLIFLVACLPSWAAPSEKVEHKPIFFHKWAVVIGIGDFQYPEWKLKLRKE